MYVMDQWIKDRDFIMPFVSYFLVASELGVVDYIHHHFDTCQLIGNTKPLKVCRCKEQDGRTRVLFVWFMAGSSGGLL